MATQLPRYPLDPTGTSPDNLVVGETHTLPNRTIRALATLYGAFFTESVVVRDRANNQVLQRNVQYTATELYEFPTGRWGKEICGIILITDEAVSNEVEVDYQALGGEYSTNVDAIVSMFNEAMLERPVSWPNILGQPDEFNPAAHFHDVGDIYGFEYVVNALERLRSAVLIGDAASHEEILKYIDRQDADIRADTAVVAGHLSEHTANTNNPHNTTKAQVGLGDVENYPIATTTQAQTGTGNAYMTPALVKLSITPELTPFQSHIANTSNPHSTTATQVGLGNVQNYGIASQAEAEAGTSNTTYVTPLRTSQAITALALAPLAVHVARADNPHATTATQVGLGNVSNFAVATQAEAEAGTSNVAYMTPLRTAQAITTLAGAAFTSHTTNTNNPHNTTAAQVGLGSVQNFGIASQAEAQAGTSNILYMTPLRVSQAITTLALGPLGTHTARVDNPHSTTKAQVGLSNVDNFATSSQAEAEAGTNGITFMTPLRTAQAIAVQATSPLNIHIARTDNPHNTTASQVGLGSVQNYTIATQAEAQAGTSNTTYMTPLRTSQAITTLALGPLGTHTARTDNPHSVTKAQVGLGSVENLAVASQAEAQAGVSNTVYMTPLRTSQAITTLALGPLGTHTARTDNPHSTTASQVGLGSVSNYAVASTGEAQAGASNTTYMTPLLTAQAISSQALSPLNTHIGRTDNPHATTATQVGLGNVSNYGNAGITEAQAGTADNYFMTPLRTAQAISAQALSPLNTHIARTDNPHSTTKAQVGLGSVNNFDIATTAEAQAGTSNVKYMTPALTEQRMAVHVASGDHDSRYPRLNANVSASIRENSGRLEAFIGGAWQIVWPPQWQ
jgi:hypothetical protein